MVDSQGNSVTAGVHPMGDLAPRDVVAGAIDARLRAIGDECVYLDARGIEDFGRRFPTVAAACRAAGIDPVRQPIPVAPGAHYSCGGVVTDVHGRTELPGLFAAGEVGRTGMHGANRLASNSLLEGLVVGGRAGRAAAEHAALLGRVRATAGEPAGCAALARGDLQRAMSRDASVVRDADGLRRLIGTLSEAPLSAITTRAGLEDAALTVAARAVATAALAREESRGCHHRAEYADAAAAPARSLVVRLALTTARRSRSWRRSADGPPATIAERSRMRRSGVMLSDDELVEARATIARALDEDLRYGPDITTAATVPEGAVTTASLITREPGVIAGVDIAILVLDEVLGRDGYRIVNRVEDGARLQPGAPALTVEARMHGLLTAERTLLNLVCHLSGIATATAAWVDAVNGTKTKIRDTRKTLPGLRALQKYAVRVGGGVNHRLGLGDAALIKDNHVAAAGSVVAALRAVRAAAPDLPCEVEVDSLEQLDEILAEGAELVLLDNFPVWQTQIAAQRRDTRAPATKLESSGGLSLDTAADYAGTGVDYLAVGALTHSVRVLDIGLDV